MYYTFSFRPSKIKESKRLSVENTALLDSNRIVNPIPQPL